MTDDGTADYGGSGSPTYSPSDTEVPEQQRTDLEKTLSTLKLSELQKWAKDVGALDGEVDTAVDAENPKQSLITLILSKMEPHHQMPTCQHFPCEQETSSSHKAELKEVKEETASSTVLRELPPDKLSLVREDLLKAMQEMIGKDAKEFAHDVHDLLDFIINLIQRGLAAAEVCNEIKSFEKAKSWDDRLMQQTIERSIIALQLDSSACDPSGGGALVVTSSSSKPVSKRRPRPKRVISQSTDGQELLCTMPVVPPHVASGSRTRSRSYRRERRAFSPRRLSKALNQILRHGDTDSNVEIYSDGFAPVGQVVQALRHFPHITQEDVRQIVVQSIHKDGEPRFEIRADTKGNLEIRSRRKHTIAGIIVDPAPCEQNHCTSERHREHLSRGLSAILRHKNTSSNLRMSVDGYVPLYQVLQAMRDHRDRSHRSHRHPPSPAQLLEVVRTSLHSDGKPRFEISGEMIRATRYHSIEGVSLDA